MNTSISTRLLWPYGPIKALFSAVAVVSGLGLYLAAPQFRQSPALFVSTVVVLFTAEVLLFRLGLRKHERAVGALSRATANRVVDFSELTDAVMNLTRSNEMLYVMLGQLLENASKESRSTEQLTQAARVVLDRYQELQKSVREDAGGSAHWKTLIEHVAAIRESNTDLKQEIRFILIELKRLNSSMRASTRSHEERPLFLLPRAGLERSMAAEFKKSLETELTSDPAAVTSVIRTLPKLQQQILFTLIFEDRSPLQIARELQVTGEVVDRSVMLFKARLAAAKKFKEEIQKSLRDRGQEPQNP